MDCWSDSVDDLCLVHSFNDGVFKTEILVELHTKIPVAANRCDDVICRQIWRRCEWCDVTCSEDM